MPAPTVTSTQGNNFGVAAGTFSWCVFASAIQLLPHLIEAVYGAGRVGVVVEELAVGQLKGTSGKMLTLVMRVSGVLEVRPVPPETKNW